MTDELLSRLQSFAIDAPGAAMSFAERLAAEQGWSAAFTARVLDEYRRFLWLAMRAGHPVTPSPAVDAAWHLHLSYSRSYWDELCGRILQRPLHHDPTRGGAKESAKYHDWYSRTLTSYQQQFGAPAADIWPTPTERFRGGLPRVVDRRTHWIVEKRLVGRMAVGALACSALLALTGCASWWADAWTGTVILVAIGIGLLLVFVAKSARRRRRRGKGAGKGGPAGGGGAGVGSCGTAASSDSGCGNDSGCGGSGDGGGSGCGGGGGD
jgi:hypothetical protein